MISGRWPCRCRPPPPIRGHTRNRLLVHWGAARRQTGARQAPSLTFAAAGAAFWLRPSKITCRCIVPWGEDTERWSGFFAVSISFWARLFPDGRIFTERMFVAWSREILRISHDKARPRLMCVRKFCLHLARTQPKTFVPDRHTFPRQSAPKAPCLH